MTHSPFIEPLESRIAPSVFLVTTFLDVTNDTHTSGSLRDAIFNANALAGADEIQFGHLAHGKIGPAHGTVKLLSDLPAITDALTIDSPLTKYHKIQLAIDGNKHRLFQVNASAPIDLTFSGLTLKGGTTNFGGAMYLNDAGGQITIQHCTLSGNHALGASGTPKTTYGYLAKGGAIDLEKGSLTIVSSKISGNSAVGGQGSAGYESGGYGGGNGFGGGVYVGNGGTFLMSASTISGNAATGGAGGAGAKTYNGGNGGHGFGGGVCNFGTASLQTTIISGNAAKAGTGGTGGGGGNGGNGGNACGAGLYAGHYSGTPGALKLLTTTITGNTATLGKAGAAGSKGTAGLAGISNGGGLFSYSIAMDISDLTIVKNKASQSNDLSVSLTAGLSLGPAGSV